MEPLPIPVRRRGRPPKLRAEESQVEVDVPYDLIDDAQKLIVNRFESRYKPVQRVQFHTGVQLGNRVRNSLDADVDNADMVLVEHGVYIKIAAGNYIVGMPDILWVKLK